MGFDDCCWATGTKPTPTKQPMMRIGSLFTGYGGLDLAVEEFYDARTVWCSDIDPGACKIIAHRMPGIPNLGDITVVDWPAVEPVDILCGGWPCQPFSLAGKRKGAADERALWPFVAGAVRALRPRLVVLENVAAIATAGELARASADLAMLGYVGSWRCLRAADVGAPHGRARIFIVATDAQGGRRLRERQHSFVGGDSRGTLSTQPAGTSAALADAAGNGRQQGRPEPARLVGGSDAAQRSDAATDTDGHAVRQQPVRELGSSSQTVAGLASATATDTASGRLRASIQDDDAGQPDIAWGSYEPAIRRWERNLGRDAPAPTETSPKGSQRLSPRFVEWMMGLPAGWVCDVPGLTRNEQLKALGNGVVPQQALEALRRMQAAAAAA